MTVTPLRVPSSASLASRSACWFRSRGTQVYVVPNGASRLASMASGFMSGCLIFQRPDICSTTSLESIRTSTSASGAYCSASRRPGDQPGVLRDVVRRHPDRGALLGDHLAGLGVLEDRAVRRGAGVAARAAVGLDQDGAVGHSPDSGVRTRIREHSSQRITSLLGARLMTASSAVSMPSWQPVQRRWCSAAAPTPPFWVRSFS